ncbi:hypothetical protein EXIGLDRAFT_58376 [Exidia glandulosa HHB12029]|uniref:Uncharacterized protein n=1 Tax=Exidia glandulosa HHB12029 TaxID=1314781 RepID=A0A165I6R4_EXIGL|nr:hypothetical protein EXIGLDRAFT_58376 [Exidia glandulosa HHB12029]
MRLARVSRRHRGMQQRGRGYQVLLGPRRFQGELLHYPSSPCEHRRVLASAAQHDLHALHVSVPLSHTLRRRRSYSPYSSPFTSLLSARCMLPSLLVAVAVAAVPAPRFPSPLALSISTATRTALPNVKQNSWSCVANAA